MSLGAVPGANVPIKAFVSRRPNPQPLSIAPEDPVTITEELEDVEDGLLVRAIRPNLDLFVGWAFFAAMYTTGGWVADTRFEQLVHPILFYLLPLIVGYTAGRIIIASERGGTLGAFVTMGTVVASDASSTSSSPMIIGAVIFAPLITLLLALLDAPIEWVVERWGRIPVVYVLSASVRHACFILVCLAGSLLGFLITEPVVTWLITAFDDAIDASGRAWLPLASVFVAISKALFLGGDLLTTDVGSGAAGGVLRSSFAMLRVDPGPGLGVLLAFMLKGPRLARITVPLAIVVHLFGGIQAICAFYVLMKPLTVLALILGGVSGAIVFDLSDTYVMSAPVPATVMRIHELTPSDKVGGLWGGIALSAATAFFVAYFVLWWNDAVTRRMQAFSSSLVGVVERVPAMKVMTRTLPQVLRRPPATLSTSHACPNCA